MVLIVAQSLGAFDGLGEVWDVPAAPTADLVAEYPKSACPATADGAFSDDASLRAAQVWDRCLLDDERRLWDSDLESGVVEVARRAPLQPRRECLVDAPVKSDEVPTGAEGQPVQVDCGRDR